MGEKRGVNQTSKTLTDLKRERFYVKAYFNLNFYRNIERKEIR